MSTTKTFEWKRIKVSVKAMGEDKQPWLSALRGGDKSPVMRYEVSVRVGESSLVHTTSAWGSINEYEKYVDCLRKHLPKKAEETLDYKGIAALVVDELASALNDPDEFLEMVVGDQKGRAAIDALRTGERTILAACRLGQSVVEAAEQIREEGLL